MRCHQQFMMRSLVIRFNSATLNKQSMNKYQYRCKSGLHAAEILMLLEVCALHVFYYSYSLGPCS